MNLVTTVSVVTKLERAMNLGHYSLEDMLRQASNPDVTTVTTLPVTVVTLLLNRVVTDQLHRLFFRFRCLKIFLRRYGRYGGRQP